MVRHWNSAIVTLLTIAMSGPVAWGQWSAVEQPDQVDILHAGQLITSYVFRSGFKPVLWPIVGPDGHRMTRSYPIDATQPGEDHDHPHHRGLWMTFGEVDGMDWWAEGTGRGTVEHQRVVERIETDSSAGLIAEHVWKSPSDDEGKAKGTVRDVINETCRYEVSGTPDETIIDCEYVLRSSDPKREVEFGDTKEGMFAIRVPEPMRGDKPGGQLLSSAGDRGGDVWGKSAAWVDYSGPVIADSPEIYGIAILVHPTSFRAEGLWHARTYGLFAHNPFGVHDFLPNRTKTPSAEIIPAYEGGYRLAAGEALHFCYRVILHRDRWSVEEGNRRMEVYASQQPRLR